MINEDDVLLKLSLPLYILHGSRKKKFILNLNNYPNMHYRTLNNCKKLWKDMVRNMIPDNAYRIPGTTKVKAIFIYYATSKRLVDLSNPCCVIDKFTMDAVVSAGILVDDNIKHVTDVQYKYGGVDRNNPRCDFFLVKQTNKGYNPSCSNHCG